MSVLHPFMEHCDDVVLSGALHHHEVFHKEAILNIPTDSETTRAGVEQIPHLFVVNLCETSFNVELLLAHGHRLPHVANSLQEQAIIASFRLPILLAQRIFISHHGEGLS